MGVAIGPPFLLLCLDVGPLVGTFGGLQFTGSQVAVGSGVVAVAKAVAVEGCVVNARGHQFIVLALL